ncbi:hypothetical protein [Methylobacterium sp. PvR107]|uniref:hypothetical protein n=1 Tax=Methylobacterium sp. PvR107 TaxID=2806597 RepID=UPI001AE9E8FE|nr:hypothetical protein [Methylobacterium sp. PvR107]MBP1183805.1 hypothetical protein [Methylobacterium sp. PvR107]
MEYAYMIRAIRSDETVRLPCASAWIARERCHLFEQQDWGVAVFDLKGAFVTGARLEALAQAEFDAAVRGVEP